MLFTAVALDSLPSQQQQASVQGLDEDESVSNNQGMPSINAMLSHQKQEKYWHDTEHHNNIFIPILQKYSKWN